MAARVVVPLGPAYVDITGVRAGDRNQMTITVRLDGSPVDLTGQTVTAQARKTTNAPDPPAVTAVIEVTDAAAGALILRWPGDAVRAVLGTATKWDGVWDMQVQGSSEDPVTVAAGKFAAVSDVTR